MNGEKTKTWECDEGGKRMGVREKFEKWSSLLWPKKSGHKLLHEKKKKMGENIGQGIQHVR